MLLACCESATLALVFRVLAWTGAFFGRPGRLAFEAVDARLILVAVLITVSLGSINASRRGWSSPANVAVDCVDKRDAFEGRPFLPFVAAGFDCFFAKKAQSGERR